jgi:hypothetical protein
MLTESACTMAGGTCVEPGTCKERGGGRVAGLLCPINALRRRARQGHDGKQVARCDRNRRGGALGLRPSRRRFDTLGIEPDYSTAFVFAIRLVTACG